MLTSCVESLEKEWIWSVLLSLVIRQCVARRFAQTRNPKDLSSTPVDIYLQCSKIEGSAISFYKRLGFSCLEGDNNAFSKLPMCLQEVVKNSPSWINDESESGCPMFLMYLPAGKFRLSSINIIDDEKLKEVEKKSNTRLKLMSKWSDEVEHNLYYAFYPEELNYVKAFTTTFMSKFTTNILS